ncbi:MAG: acyl carrier protein [Desulfuromonas sp.]|nr:MAG: acyl carrier protein [Desulfuromonas sp.]
MSDNLERELIDLVIDFCNVDDVDPEEIAYDLPLIGPDSPFDLDSLDAVEIVVAVQKTYGVRIANDNTSREVLQSLTALANYIRDNRPA